VGVVDGVVAVPAEDEELLVLLTLVPEPSGVAPPPAIIVDPPPVAGALVVDGVVTVVVEVVTVVWIGVAVTAVAGALWTCVCASGVITVGAASSGGLTPAAADCVMGATW
jgi:hypothetical protein